MPVLRAASAPNRSPSTVVPSEREDECERRVPAEGQALGSRRRRGVVTMLPIMNPAHPMSIVWASEIMPP